MHRSPAGTPEQVLGIDVGGTGIRLALAPADRPDSVLRSTRIPAPARIGTDGQDAAALLERLLPALAELVTPGIRVTAVAVGATGMALLGRELAAELPTPLARATGARRLVLASDAVSAYAGALGPHPGAVVAAGTGVVALGLHPAPSADPRPTSEDRPGATAAWRRVDGWGQLLGDCGGGSWLGRAGLEAALRAQDGRTGGSPALLTLARERYGPADGLPAALQTRADRAGLLAAFAPDVAAAAAQGCPVSAELLRRAGAEIAATATAAVAGLREPRLALTGGLFNLEPLRAATLAALPPEVRLHTPDGPPLLGALRLAASTVTAADPPWPVSPPLLDVRDL
ncbi:BadF/BadG/BcrA/BcrD ATPase family protein [Kitasatospora sp. NPDC051853]|uniref:BadF/BadG/BcrA/BcrD ATPase family protein n=1 Tax=Kitasatospora sp. NPDC051853 TaxID=3364058 RepID=UPI0037ACF063